MSTWARTWLNTSGLVAAVCFSVDQPDAHGVKPSKESIVRKSKGCPKIRTVRNLLSAPLSQFQENVTVATSGTL